MNMIRIVKPVVFIVMLFCALPLHAVHKGVYPFKKPHEGKNIKPKDAYELLNKNPGSSYIVDVRSRYECQDIGHPVGAYNIPVFFYTTETGPKGYKMIPNDNFCRDLKARFNPEKDSLLMICRSGERSTTGVTEAIRCGFSKDRVYNVLGGFEGDRVHEDVSLFRGQRMVGGMAAGRAALDI